LTEYLFEHQDEMSQDNVKDRALKVLSKRKDLDLRQLDTCVPGNAGVALVARDEAVAKPLAIRSTPTLFINGRRVVPLQSQNQLEDLLTRELHAETVSAKTQTTE
jgi:protein-disulfide isomerase